MLKAGPIMLRNMLGPVFNTTLGPVFNTIVFFIFVFLSVFGGLNPYFIVSAQIRGRLGLLGGLGLLEVGF